jgi:hypothetical protein
MGMSQGHPLIRPVILLMLAICLQGGSQMSSLAAQEYFETSAKEFPKKYYGSEENLRLIQTTTKVTVSRLMPPLREDGGTDAAKLFKDGELGLTVYKVERTMEVPVEELKKLRRILKDSKSSRNLGPKACGPIFAVRFSFGEGPEAVEVNLCLACKLLATTRGSTIVGVGPVDGAGRELVSIAKKLFPDDEEIMELE